MLPVEVPKIPVALSKLKVVIAKSSAMKLYPNNGEVSPLSVNKAMPDTHTSDAL